MATITITENARGGYYPSAALATHTFTITSSAYTYIDGGDDYLSIKAPTVAVKYSTNNSGRTCLEDSFRLVMRLGDSDKWKITYTTGITKLAYNTNKTMTAASSSRSLYIPDIFNASNPTTKTIPIHWRIQGSGLVQTGVLGSQGAMEVVGYRNFQSTDTFGGVNEGTITLNAPPTFDTTQVAFDTPYVYAGYTKARVTVSNLSAKYGGNISSAVLTIGSQTASRADNGDLVITLENGGTFIPTVKVTDSRGQVTTKTLNPITVNVYTAPTVSFSVERTDSTGNINDEGESAVVTAKFNWTDEIATLSAPTIVCKDPNGITVSATPTWYTDRALTMPITDWSQVAEGVDIYCLLDNATHDAFDTQYSYQIAITPTDSESDGTTITQTLGSAFYTIDFLAGGHGIAFGQPSSQEGFFCNMDSHFKDKAGVVRALFDFVYPVGSYYETSDTTFDPNTAWGGTWVLEAEGIVHVSAGTSYAVTHANDNAGVGAKDGGDSTVTLSLDQIPSHNHGSAGPAFSWNFLAWTGSNPTGKQGENFNLKSPGSGSALGTVYGSFSSAHTHSNNGGGQAHTNMQPYIVVNRWHRTA